MRKALLPIITLSVVFLSFLALLTRTSLLSQFVASPEIQAQSAEQCSVIGNNLAVQYENSAVSVLAGEANYTLGILNTANDVQPIINAINSHKNKKFIIRVGASTDSLGPNALEYAEMITNIRQQTADFGGGLAPEIVVMISHNEANGQEAFAVCKSKNPGDASCDLPKTPDGSRIGPDNPDFSPLMDQIQTKSLQVEVEFARTLLNRVGTLENLTFITGQIDNYFNSSPTVDGSRAAEFATALLRISDSVTGVALPLYTTGVFPNDLMAYEHMARTIDEINDRSGRTPDIYITESGPFADYKTGFESDFETYVRNVAAAVQHPQLKALLLFNAGGINQDDLFKYTEPFWSESCREAFRTSCANVAEIVSVCGTPTGDHSCRSFCKGTPYEPCKSTPGNDCSIPFDPQDIISQSVSDSKREKIATYLKNFFALAEPNVGLQFQYKGFLRNADVCDPEHEQFDLYNEICQNGFSEQAEVELDLTYDEHTIFPSENADIQGARFLNNRAAIDSPNGQGQEFSVNSKLSSDKLWWDRMANLQRLKEECYIDDIVIENKNDPFFGIVRCVNYIEFKNKTAELQTERDVFYGNGENERGPLWACIQAPGGPACETAFLSLNKGLQKEILQISTIPVATFPIIGAIEELSPTSDPNASYQDTKSVIQSVGGTPTNEEGEAIGNNNILFLNKLRNLFSNTPDAPGGEEQGRLYTMYYVKSITGVQDAFLASDQVSDQISSEFSQTRFESRETGFFTRIADILSNTRNFLSETPFSRGHIPEDLRDDQRFVEINYFFNKPDNFEVCISDNTNADSSVKDEEVAPLSGPSNFLLQFTTTAANFTNLVTQIGLGTLDTSSNDVDHIQKDIELQKFIACEAFPQGLRETDERTRHTISSFLPETAWDNHFNEACSAYADFATDLNYEGEIKTQSRSCVHYRTAGNPTPSNYCCGYPCNPGSASDSLDPDLPACPASCTTLVSPSLDLAGEVINRQDRQPGVLFGGRETDIDGNNTTTSVLTPGGQPLYCQQHEFAMKALLPEFASSTEDSYYCFIEKATGKEICAAPEDEDSGGSVGSSCKVDGGFPIADPNLKALIGSTAKTHNIPAELIMAVLFIENCRSNTLYNGQTASICDDPSSNLEGFLSGDALWTNTAGCSDPTNPASRGAGVLQANSSFIAQYYNSSMQACNIPDSFTGAALHFKAKGPNKPASQWTLDEMKSTLFLWILGNGSITSCPDIENKSSWNSIDLATGYYCGVIERLVLGSSGQVWTTDRLPDSQVTTNCN